RASRIEIFTTLIVCFFNIRIVSPLESFPGFPFQRSKNQTVATDRSAEKYWHLLQGVQRRFRYHFAHLFCERPIQNHAEGALVSGMSRNEQDGTAKIWIKHAGMRHQQRTRVTFCSVLR